jgi:hypothetical protein
MNPDGKGGGGRARFPLAIRLTGSASLLLPLPPAHPQSDSRTSPSRPIVPPCSDRFGSGRPG